MTTPDPTMAAITDAVTAGRSGDTAAARLSLESLWDEIGPDGDALHRCTLAHFLADLYDDAATSLVWDARALEAADSLDDTRVQQEHASLQIRGSIRRCISISPTTTAAWAISMPLPSTSPRHVSTSTPSPTTATAPPSDPASTT